MRTTTQLIILCAALLVAPLTARQERVTTGPPPQICTWVEAVTAAVLDGSPDAWETMARERFAPDLLAKADGGRTPANLRQVERGLCLCLARSRHAARSGRATPVANGRTVGTGGRDRA